MRKYESGDVVMVISLEKPRHCFDLYNIGIVTRESPTFRGYLEIISTISSVWQGGRRGLVRQELHTSQVVYIGRF